MNYHLSLKKYDADFLVVEKKERVNNFFLIFTAIFTNENR